MDDQPFNAAEAILRRHARDRRAAFGAGVSLKPERQQALLREVARPATLPSSPAKGRAPSRTAAERRPHGSRHAWRSAFLLAGTAAIVTAAIVWWRNPDRGDPGELAQNQSAPASVTSEPANRPDTEPSPPRNAAPAERPNAPSTPAVAPATGEPETTTAIPRPTARTTEGDRTNTAAVAAPFRPPEPLEATETTVVSGLLLPVATPPKLTELAELASSADALQSDFRFEFVQRLAGTGDPVAAGGPAWPYVFLRLILDRSEAGLFVVDPRDGSRLPATLSVAALSSASQSTQALLSLVETPIVASVMLQLRAAGMNLGSGKPTELVADLVLTSNLAATNNPASAALDRILQSGDTTEALRLWSLNSRLVAVVSLEDSGTTQFEAFPLAGEEE